ncbi:MAG: EAL domain-containing protein, partial [Pygmaiobacter sp.]
AQLLSACSVGDPLKICARLGSDKFALFVPQQEGFAEQLITQMNRQLKLYPLDLRVTVRCGICRTSDVPANVQQMCDRAQLAGEAVRGRFDCAYAYYDGEQRRRVLEAQELIEEMHRALEQQQFEVVFQPKYNLTTGEIAGAEALVRWNHPTKGMISPENFIPLFEKNGFISMLDYYVWDIVCKQLAQWIRETKHPVPLSVNISRVDIYNPNLVEILHTLVEKYELHPAWLELEITESAYTENPEQMIEVVHALKQEGFLIEMDDFGTGYSSLNMLSEVSVDVIKMDMRFLQGAAVPGKGKNILHFVVGLSKWMGLAVIAEGIETREQVAFLRSMGCNRGQGYYFSKPLCAQEFEALLNGEATKEICSENVFSATIDINEIWNPFSQFNLLFNSYVGALGIFEYSAERMFLLRANENCYRLFSNDRESLSRATTNIMELMYEEDRLYFGNAMKNMIETNGEEICDLRFHSLLHKRKSRTLHLHIRVIYNSPERVLFLSSMEDFTEMKRLEEKLVRQREFFVRIYDTVSCGILRFSITKGLIVRSSNIAGMKLLGCERSDVENGTVDYFEMIRKEDRAMVERAVRELASEPIDSIIVIEYRIKNLRGETLWVNDNTRSMEDENGNRIYQTVLNDITLRKQREQELRLVQEQYLIATRHAHNKIFRYDPHTKQTVVFAQEVNEQMMPVLIEDLPGKMIESGRVATESV